MAIAAALEDWGGSPAPRRRLFHRLHVHSHVKGRERTWPESMNEIVDKLADLGKTLRLDRTTSQWRITRDPDLRGEDEIGLAFAGPYSKSEALAAIARRTSKAVSANGLTSAWVRVAASSTTGLDDDSFLTGLVEEANSAAYVGKYPRYEASGMVVGKHRAIGKRGGGDRHLTAPDTLQAIFSSMDAARLLNVMLDLGAFSRAQKCNISRVAGCMENVHLFMAALFDFHKAAKDRSIPIGTVRLFLLSDISKAFDRVQLDVLIQAIRCILVGIPDKLLRRVLSRIVFMFTTGQILTEKDGLVVLIMKLGGVHQGDPASPLLFAIVMEYARRLIPPKLRPFIRLYNSPDGSTLSMEIDYADDQIRCTDSVQEMREVIDQLRRVLGIIGLEWNPKKVLLVALRAGKGGVVDVFDPQIPAGDEHPGKFLKAVGKDDWFTIFGVTTNWRGESGEAFARAAKDEDDVMMRIANSPYPIPAKLWAFSSAVASKSEFLYFSMWTPRKLVEELDCEERKYVRDIFGGINLPNALILADLGLSARGWREEVVFLASLIRGLGSKDPRVQLATRVMSRDACPARLCNGVRLDPPFFDWTGPLPEERARPSLLGIPLRYAQLARKWGVGLEEVNGCLLVTLEGNVLEDPHNILRLLSKRAKARNKARLEARVSTNRNKDIAPPNAISWGVAAWKMSASARSSLTKFYSSNTPFSRAEIKILMQLRLRLWPTAMLRSVQAGGDPSAVCKCGSVQTDTHILLVPFDATAHSEELRTISKARHADAVRKVIAPVFDKMEGWETVAVESLPPSDSMSHVRDAIRAARVKGVLSGDGLPIHIDGDTVSTAQHWKPDIIVGRIVRDKLEILIFDVCFASDDKLQIEDRILNWRMKARAELKKRTGVSVVPPSQWLRSDHFDPKGAFTPKGIEALDEGLKVDARKLSVFHPARYSKRYAPLVRALSNAGLGRMGHIVVRTLAVGVGGWVPEYTMRHLKELSNDWKARPAPAVRDDLCFISQIWAIRAFRAWHREI